jgi:diguanylate cyclase (GGDEF)-like protein
MTRLQHTLARTTRTLEPVALLFLDLDNFKLINDSLGHQVGDQLLVAVATRLQSCVRPMDTIARLGGDEFTILLEDIRDVSCAIDVVERIYKALQMPFNISGHEIFTGTSIGIALSNSDHQYPNDLLRDADLAMYRAKNNGKAHYSLFDQSLSDHAQKRLELETDLRYALARGEFQLHYQPIVDLATGKITEMEALIRWLHPQHGLIAPTHFISVAEETGLILPIGEWVLTEACRQVVQWQAEYPNDQPLVISVNLSARQFQDPKLIEMISCTLEKTRLKPRCLKLEITESMMIQDSENTVSIIRNLKRLGVQLAIDDFGTGYCSLNYLKRFPVDTLKIDRSFISGLGQNPEDTAIVRAVIAFAKALALSITSEGVETSDQVRQLTTLECDRGQGYYFSKPLSCEAATRLLTGVTTWN